jgi:hypothetical protein
MRVAWSLLRKPEPTALAAARLLAHRAVQWPARAALANLDPAPDDSHASLTWDPALAALLGQPLKGGARAGLHVGVHELVFVKGKRTETFPMIGRPEGEAGAWLDARLAAEGLKPATGIKLPYELPPALFARPAEEAKNLAALSAWFAAGAELLEELRKKHKRRKPGPVRCWPHHFDIAFLVPLEEARSIGIGLSPGDEYYAQPYFYLSPDPKPDTGNLPRLPPGGRWHTKNFFGAVAAATDLLALPDPRAGLLEVFAAAFKAAAAAPPAR